MRTYRNKFNAYDLYLDLYIYISNSIIVCHSQYNIVSEGVCQKHIKKMSFDKKLSDREIMEGDSPQLLPDDPKAQDEDVISPYSTSCNNYKSCSLEKTYLIGVGGGSSSGKTSVCEAIVEKVKQNKSLGKETKISIISQESFYRELTQIEQERANIGMFNFDHPDAVDFDLMYSSLLSIKKGHWTNIPVYDLKSQIRVPDTYVAIEPCHVVLVEGILAFYRKEILDMFDMKLYVDADSDTRLSRRLIRDMEERGRSLEHVLQQYTLLVKPAFQEFCVPTKKYADVIFPRGSENVIGITVISQRIVDILEEARTCQKSCVMKQGL